MDSESLRSMDPYNVDRMNQEKLVVELSRMNVDDVANMNDEDLDFTLVTILRKKKPRDVANILQSMSPQHAAIILEHMLPIDTSILKLMSPQQAAKILLNMHNTQHVAEILEDIGKYPRIASAILRNFTVEKIVEILPLMDIEIATNIIYVIDYTTDHNIRNTYYAPHILHLIDTKLAHTILQRMIDTGRYTEILEDMKYNNLDPRKTDQIEHFKEQEEYIPTSIDTQPNQPKSWLSRFGFTKSRGGKSKKSRKSKTRKSLKLKRLRK